MSDASAQTGVSEAPAPSATPTPAGNGGPILEVEHLVKHFPIKAGILFDQQIGAVQAVDDVSFTVNRGETLGLVGESGCGKSTLARSILQLIEPTSGSVRFEGKEITGLQARESRSLRPADADGLPGPVRLAEPAQADRPDHRRPDANAQDRRSLGRARRGPQSCSRWSG